LEEARNAVRARPSRRLYAVEDRLAVVQEGLESRGIEKQAARDGIDGASARDVRDSDVSLS
jgi:hypothetical protein